jgi:hypothetical protein
MNVYHPRRLSVNRMLMEATHDERNIHGIVKTPAQRIEPYAQETWTCSRWHVFANSN